MPKPTMIINAESGWLGGFADQVGQATAAEVGRPATYDPASVGIDIFRTIGRLRAGFAPSNPTNQSVVTDVILWFVPRITNTKLLYGYGSNGRLYEVNVNTHTVTSNATFPRAVASSSGQGLEEFRNELYYTRNTDICKFDYGSTFTEPVSGHTGLTQTVFGTDIIHTLKNFRITNRLYIGDAARVISTDGTTLATSGLYTLALGAGQVPECIVEWRDQLLIGLDLGLDPSWKSKAWLVVWDGISPDIPNAVYPFPDSSLRNIQVVGDRVFCLGSGGFYEWEGGANFSRISDIGTSRVGHVSSNRLGMVYFGNGADLYAYGSPRVNFLPKAFYSPLSTGTDNPIIGAITWTQGGIENSGTLYVSRDLSPTLVYFNTGNQTGRFWRSKRIRPGQRVKIRQVRIITDQLSTGDTLTVQILDENGTATSLGTADRTADGAINKKDFFPVLGPFYEFQVQLTFTAGAVLAREIHLWLEPASDYAAR